MKRYFAIIPLILITLSSCAQEGEIYATRKGAIQGYDPVAYFSDQQPVKGSNEHTYGWKGATWHFATAENAQAFEADPEQYAPQYGGYCAYAVANGYTAKIDPESWKIVDGKLYLNYNKKVQAEWEANQQEFIQQANQNWPQVLEK